MSKTCDKCGAGFGSQRDLQKHLNRKRPCNAIVDEDDRKKQHSPHECEDCGQVFTTRMSKSRHKKKYCRSRDGKEREVLRDRAYKKQAQEIKKQAEDFKEMKQQLLELQLTTKDSATSPIANTTATPANSNLAITTNSGIAGMACTGGTVNQQIEQKYDQRVQLQFNIFGRETFDHISQAEMGGALIKASEELSKIGVRSGSKVGQNYLHVQAASIAMQHIMGMIYANKQAPENATCYMPNRKESLVAVRGEGGKWEKKPLKTIAPTMREKAINAAFERQPMDDEASEQCAAMLSILRDHKEKLTTDQALVSVKAVLEQVKGLLEQLPVKIGEDFKVKPQPLAASRETKRKSLLPPGEKSSLPIVQDPLEGDTKTRPVLTREECEALEELYPPQHLKTITIRDALDTMAKAELTQDEQPIETIDAETALAILISCARLACPWDEISAETAFRRAELLFDEIGRTKTSSDTTAQTRQKAERISLWGRVKTPRNWL